MYMEMWMNIYIYICIYMCIISTKPSCSAWADPGVTGVPPPVPSSPRAEDEGPNSMENSLQARPDPSMERKFEQALTLALQSNV